MTKNNTDGLYSGLKRVTPKYDEGLNASQVEERMQIGAHNLPLTSQTRSSAQIVRDNVFTLFNMINVVLGLLIIMVGSYKNLFFLGVAVSNTLIGIFQELRAKHNIDRLTIIAQAKVTVVRDKCRLSIKQDELVLDDIMYIETGDQICSDGIIVHDDGLEVDESQLTGESHAVKKPTGTTVLSGSFVTSGSAYVKVEAVGAESYVSKLSKEAKREKKPSSELSRSLKLIIRTLTFVIIPLGLALFYTQYKKGVGLEASVLGSAAAMIGMIPEGLVLLTSVAFAVGAIKLSKNKVLVQSMPCIETLARVDVLCLDKTGTITDGKLTVSDTVLLYDFSLNYIENVISAMMNSLPDMNATAKALRVHYDKNPNWTTLEKLPFSSERKWSGCTFEKEGTFKLGAPEFLFQKISDETMDMMNQYSSEAYRILALVHSNTPISEKQSEEGRLVAFILISDNIRKEASATFDYFMNEGVAVKVISGDNPRTASNIAALAGIPDADSYIDMNEVSDDAAYDRLVEDHVVFGRVSPYQKRKIINALQKNGHIVAMTGDGVNDVLALKDADCSIAMAEGSDAARHISDFVLLTSNFDTMIGVVKEGRRVVNNIERVAALFLVKTIYSVMLTTLFIFLRFQFPLRPIQLSLISLLTIGIPSFILALKPSYERIQGNFLNSILEISLPGAICIIIDFILVQIFGQILGLSFTQTSTISVMLAGTVGFIVLIHVAHPLDTKRKIMIGTLVLAFISIILFWGNIFSLTTLFSAMAILYIPLLIIVYPMFDDLSFLCRKAIHYINKLMHHKKGKD